MVTPSVQERQAYFVRLILCTNGELDALQFKEGRPIAGAKVTDLDFRSMQTTTESNGTFVLASCDLAPHDLMASAPWPHMEWMVSCHAQGVRADGDAVRIVLQPTGFIFEFHHPPGEDQNGPLTGVGYILKWIDPGDDVASNDTRGRGPIGMTTSGTTRTSIINQGVGMEVEPGEWLVQVKVKGYRPIKPWKILVKTDPRRTAIHIPVQLERP